MTGIQGCGLFAKANCKIYAGGCGSAARRKFSSRKWWAIKVVRVFITACNERLKVKSTFGQMPCPSWSASCTDVSAAGSVIPLNPELELPGIWYGSSFEIYCQAAGVQSKVGKGRCRWNYCVIMWGHFDGGDEVCDWMRRGEGSTFSSETIWVANGNSVPGHKLWNDWYGNKPVESSCWKPEFSMKNKHFQNYAAPFFS